MSPTTSWTLIGLLLGFLYLLLYALLRASSNGSRKEEIESKRFDRWKLIEKAKERERELR